MAGKEKVEGYDEVYRYGYDAGYDEGYAQGYHEGIDDYNILNEAKIYNQAIVDAMKELDKYTFTGKEEILSTLELMQKV